MIIQKIGGTRTRLRAGYWWAMGSVIDWKLYLQLPRDHLWVVSSTSLQRFDAGCARLCTVSSLFGSPVTGRLVNSAIIRSDWVVINHRLSRELEG
jgi:hypothetical protein